MWWRKNGYLSKQIDYVNEMPRRWILKNEFERRDSELLEIEYERIGVLKMGEILNGCLYTIN